MEADRLLLGTVFVQAILNRRDQYHVAASTLLPRAWVMQDEGIFDAATADH